MKKLFLIMMMTAAVCFSQKIVTIVGSYPYKHGASESQIQARQMAINLAMRDAVERYATRISSTTVVEDFEMKKDRIVANSVALLRNVNYTRDEYDRGTDTYHIALTAEIDEDEVMKLLKEGLTASAMTGKITDLVETGMSAEKGLRIGCALRNYYWAYLLVRSDEMNRDLRFENFDKRLLSVALNDKINSIFHDIVFRTVTVTERDNSKRIVLTAHYGDKPVTNLGFTYYTGESWTPYLTTAQNGLAELEFFGHSARDLDRIQLRVEFRYENQIQFNDDVKKAVEKTTHIPYPSAGHNVRVEISQPPVAESSAKSEQVVRIEKDVHIEAVESILEAIRNKEYNAVRSKFTRDGFNAFNDLIMYGNASVILEEAELKKYKLNDQIIVRSVPMSFHFPRSGRKFTENVIFTFNEENQVDAITFALADIAANDILNKPDTFGTVEEKIQIIHFMEIYKTAYSLKQIDYIESIFADNALIIVGRMLHPGEEIGEMYESLSKNKRVHYDEMGKTEYVRRLKNVFDANEFVNIHFEENNVEKMNREKVYGIEIKQFYYSQRYSDEGYLFLLMDLRDIRQPKIYVRAWQPDSMKVEDRIKISDISINF